MDSSQNMSVKDPNERKQLIIQKIAEIKMKQEKELEAAKEAMNSMVEREVKFASGVKELSQAVAEYHKQLLVEKKEILGGMTAMLNKYKTS